MKQYLPKKPVKRGFKVWVRADGVNGYVCEFEVYTGKTDGERELGLVKRLTRNITGHTSSQAPLFFDLLQDKIYACGTYNATRKCYPKDLKGKAKCGIGSHGTTGWKLADDTVAGYKNSLCIVCQPHSETPVSRRQKNGSRVDVPCQALQPVHEWC